jgi:hypothetical protein
MITTRLEELLLKQKAQRFQITIGDGPVSVIPVPPGKTIIITDIEIIPSINAPGRVPEDFARGADDILYQFIKVYPGFIDATDQLVIRQAIFEQLQKTISRSCVQLIEQSAKINNTYTCAPNLSFESVANPVWDTNTSTLQYAINTRFGIQTKNSKFEVYSIHADNISLRWVYFIPIPNPDVFPEPPVFNLTFVEPQNAFSTASKLSNTFFDNPTPQGIATTLFNILVTTLIRNQSAAEGAWVPVGVEQLSKIGSDFAVAANGFNYVRYPIITGPTFPPTTNNNLSAGTVDYGYEGTYNTDNISLSTSIIDYIGLPKANIGYCVINENLTF